MINKLLLQLGSDIPFVEAQIDIHQPKMNEVALIGENTVYNACFFIDFQKDLISCIDNTNYDIFRDIIRKMFCLEELKASSTTSYNPADERARKIAEKLSKRKNKGKEDNEESKMDSLFDKYISILSVGLQKDKNSFSSYTIYQLLDEYNRFQAKISYEAYVQAKLAGAENLDEVDHWMNNNLHS